MRQLYIYIYRERERERERNTSIDTKTKTMKRVITKKQYEIESCHKSYHKMIVHILLKKIIIPSLRETLITSPPLLRQKSDIQSITKNCIVGPF